MISDNKNEEEKVEEQKNVGTDSADVLAKRRAARKAAAKKKNRKKLFVAVPVSIILVGILGFAGYRFFFSKEEIKNETTEVKVTRGNIVNVIEGSGTIEAKAQYEVKYLNSVDVVADYFEEGDYVKKDQALYQMDSEDIQRNITKQQRNVEKAQMNYDEVNKNISNLNVKTDIKGVITNLYVSKGDSVSNGTKIADIVDKDTLVITIPFGADDAKNIQKGQSAEVTILNSLTNLSGIVTNVGSGTYVNSYGVEVTDIEIEARNPSSVSEGTAATAVIGDYACYDSAPLKYANSKTIIAKASGEVSAINKKKGDAVSAGTTLVKLVSDNSNNSVREAKMNLDDARSTLDQLLKSKEDATIRAEIDGKVIQKNIKAGEILDSNTSSTMAIIADLSSLKFNISIDELDISKISVGQEVTITADALAGQTFKGSVTNVSIVGTAYQGVTSYPVTVTIENAEETDLIPGMNVEAQIVIDSSENVLRVPVSALRNGNLVIVKDDGTFTDPLDADLSVFMSKRSGGKNSKSSLSALKGNSKTQVPDVNPDDNAAPKRPDVLGGANPGKGQLNPDSKTQNPGQRKPDPTAGNGSPVKTPGKSPDAGSNPTAGNKQAFPDGDKSGKQASSASRSQGDILTKDMLKMQKERLEGMIKTLDVPDGYTVVLVKTGLNDGSYVEIEEIKGSLKEGDTVLIPAVVNTGSQNQSAMPGGGFPGGGMPGGGFSGGGMPRGNMTGGGMPRGNTAGGSNTNRQTTSGANRQNGGAMR